jgi:hypothetical protein
VRQIRVLLTDEQYEFAKSQGRLWLRDVVQLCMDHPSVLLWNSVPDRVKPWWRFW